MLRFDPLSYTVHMENLSCKLQPLSFRLLEVLASHRNEIVKVDELMKQVWDGVLVSPETVKQRVFLLRESLQKADMDPEMVQSIRGQGYRLVLREDPPGPGKSKLFSFNHTTIIVVVCIGLLGLFAWRHLIYPTQYPANNRVVFWYQADPSAQERLYSSARQLWISKLSSLEGVKYVAANQVVETATQRPGQKSRKFRAALVSYWTLFDHDGEPFVRMQLLEPKTDTVLQSMDVDVSNDVDINRAFERQAIALQRIFSAGTLPLDKDSLEDTDHLRWRQLELLSLPTREINLLIEEQAMLPDPAGNAFHYIRKLEQFPDTVDPSLAKEIRELFLAFPENFDTKRALMSLFSAEGRCNEETEFIDDFSSAYPFAFEEFALCTPPPLSH